MIIGISGKAGSGKDTVGRIIQYLTSMRTYDKTFIEWESITKTNGRWYAGYSNWQIKKFADKLKDIVCLLIGCTREQLEDREFKEKKLVEAWWYWCVFKTSQRVSYLENKDFDKTDLSVTLIKPNIRQILQELGTDLVRNQLHPDIWVNALFADYRDKVDFNNNLPKSSNWIITDMRFPNELDAIKQRNGITIRVNRLCYDSAEDFLVTHHDKNISKIGIDINLNENSSLIDFEEPARIYGYVPLSEQHPSETALDNITFDYTIENNGTIEKLIEKVKQILIKENIIK